MAFPKLCFAKHCAKSTYIVLTYQIIVNLQSIMLNIVGATDRSFLRGPYNSCDKP